MGGAKIVNEAGGPPGRYRVRVAVGVAYGSDTAEVEQVLLGVARRATHVLSDPPPQAYFRQFGDSTLNFDLRVYIGHIDHLIATRHELHHAIAAAFGEAGIEIAFPQRDLHIRTAEALDEMVRPGSDGATERRSDEGLRADRPGGP